MDVDQSWEQHLLAQIDDFAGVARPDFAERANIGNPIPFDCDRAVVDRRPIHGHDHARADDHFSLVAAVCDRRKLIPEEGAA
jgi:hypothetical protein